MTKREVRTRAARIAPLAGLAGQTSGETVAVALARKRRQNGEAEPYARLLDRYAGVAVTAGRLLWTAAVGAVMPAATLTAFRQALTGFTAAAPVMPAELTARTVRAELGGPPEDVFADFDPVPFATGPICQVHAGVLPDGRRVAVKIRYWGAAQALRTALAGDEVRAALGPLVSSVAPETTGASLQSTAGALRGRVEESIGLRAEAACQAEFAAAYRGHPFVHVPYVVPELSTQRVLTMERVGGLCWAEALRSEGAAKNLWGEAIYRFRAGSARVLGQSVTDPGGSGNLRFHDDGTVTFLGFRGVAEVGPDSLSAGVDAGTAALLDALGATADWPAIRRERDGGGPPATPRGKLESAWTAARTGETDVH